MDEEQLRALKKELSPKLLDVSGVTAVGVANGEITVYVSRDNDAVRSAIDRVMTSSGAVARVIPAGPFKAS